MGDHRARANQFPTIPAFSVVRRPVRTFFTGAPGLFGLLARPDHFFFGARFFFLCRPREAIQK